MTHAPSGPLGEAGARLLALVAAIYTTVRGDEKSECWTIRRWLDERGIYNDDIQGDKRLIEIACKAELDAMLSAPVVTQEGE